MRQLIYRDSMLKFKEEILKTYPERAEVFGKLEKLIVSRPEAGIQDSCLLKNGKTLLCYKQTVKLFLFSGRIRYDRSQLTAQYVFDEKSAFVFNLYLSV
ncbi:MAG: hypothetical protein FWG66_11310 [Spirochaetes bacterium]|nr:hypothetical protein [Spirochaetota bacterium]